MEKSNKQYDLEQRTAEFGGRVILFCKTITVTEITRPLINQIIKSSTSIGANYMEANGADSKKDFRNKISISKKEAKETVHWLRMFTYAIPNRQREILTLLKEAHELSLIFGAICRK